MGLISPMGPITLLTPPIMKKSLFTIALASMMAIPASAQLVNTDAEWCDLMEQALQGQGVNAQVRCDMQNGQRVLHVTAAGRTSNYIVPSSTLVPDYSTPVYIVVDDVELPADFYVGGNRRDGRYGDQRGTPRGDSRRWMGPYSSTRMPEEVYCVPADVDLLVNAMRSAIGKVQRVNIVDGQYASNALREGASLYVLRTNIVALQRGEEYAKEPAPKGDGGNRAGAGSGGSRPGAGPGAGRPDAPNPNAPARKLERKYAYGALHLEMVDYTTGVVVWNCDIRDDDNTTFSSTNPMENVISHLCRDLSNGLSNLYPAVAPRPAVAGNVLQAAEEAKNKTHTLYVGLGAVQQLRKSDVLTVYVVTSVAGRVGREQIGTVSVVDVQGPELSLCKVKKGEKEIYNALHSGASLVVEGTLD